MSVLNRSPIRAALVALGSAAKRSCDIWRMCTAANRSGVNRKRVGLGVRNTRQKRLLDIEGQFRRPRRFVRRRAATRSLRHNTLMGIHRLLLLSVVCAVAGRAQHVETAQEHLDRALWLADFFNWAEAESDFAEAQKEFKNIGDRARELQARIGYRRATVDRRVLRRSVLWLPKSTTRSGRTVRWLNSASLPSTKDTLQQQR